MAQVYNLNLVWSELVIEELIRNGIDFFCISSGSRSTPLTSAVAYNKKAKKIINYDERGSGFYALGFGQATSNPAAIIVTSGTAVANLFPSVVEAFQSKIPMMILTADRPPDLQETGANQTINQTAIFGNYCKWFFNVPCPDECIKPGFVLSSIDNAIRICMSEPKGPVHLNFMFREPLEPYKINDNDFLKKYFKGIDTWMKNCAPYCSSSGTIKHCDSSFFEFLYEIILQNKKGLISIGKLAEKKDKEAILKLVSNLGWPVYADIMSGLRMKETIGTNIIKHFDMDILSEDFCRQAKPDVVLHFGERITSKRFFEFFGKYNPQFFINVKNNNLRYNPVHLPNYNIEADIPAFCERLSAKIEKFIDKQEINNFKKFYDLRAKEAQEIINKEIEKDGKLSEIFISRYLSRNIAQNFCLFLSNSMPIRDFELYADINDFDIDVGSNRGVSGIDGIIASSFGFAMGNKKICTVLIGDIAFIHDINSLSMAAKSQFPLIIILINNNGGGIFNFLPISSYNDIFKEYFMTPHGFYFKGVAESFKLNYGFTDNQDDFKVLYGEAKAFTLKHNRSFLIEASTDAKYDFRLRRGIKEEIIRMLEKQD